MCRAHSLRNAGLVFVALVALVLVVCATPVAFAAGPAATPVPASRTGIGNWQVINGQPLEYEFQYFGRGLPVQILVGMDPASSVGFSVYTDDAWRDLANGDRKAAPIGRGTRNSHAVGDLFWQMASPSSGHYHVQIYTLGAGTARYWIAQAGSGGSGLTPISPAVAVATPVPTAKPAVVAATAPTTTLAATPTVTVTIVTRVPATVTLKATPKVAVVTTAPTAATPVPASRTGIGNWQVINGQPLEYEFQYFGRGLPVQILVGMDPASSVGFSVYTDDAWRDLANGDRKAAPIGRGTRNSHAVGDLFWQMASPSSGHYHVQIYTLGAGTARYWIAQAGSGGSGLTPISPAVVTK